MTKPISTKEKLLDTARMLFWTKGYSNVSVRDITNAAGVDAALVSRYFGSKQGLFEATLATISPWDALSAEDDQILDTMVASFSHPYDPETDQANPFSMLLTNMTDPEMGDHVRALFSERMAEPLAERLGGPDASDRAALLLSSLFGTALMRKHFRLKALSDNDSEALKQKTKFLADAAMSYRKSPT